MASLAGLRWTRTHGLRTRLRRRRAGALPRRARVEVRCAGALRASAANRKSCFLNATGSVCLTHGEVEMFFFLNVLYCILAINASVISQHSFRWCRGMDSSASPQYFAACGAKASHHTPQGLAFRFHGVCLCTTGEETAASCAVTRSLAFSYIMMTHHA